MTTTIETLTKQYLTAKTTYETSKIGPKTDKAEARMESILAKADNLGLGDQLVAAVLNTDRY